MSKPTRIPPADDGSDITPTAGGSWIRDADGGLTPADAQTARAAGLRWGDEPELPDVALVVDGAIPAVPDAAPDADASGTETPQE
jgi:hypothetical protein